MAELKHPSTPRARQLGPPAAMVLCGRHTGEWDAAGESKRRSIARCPAFFFCQRGRGPKERMAGSVRTHREFGHDSASLDRHRAEAEGLAAEGCSGLIEIRDRKWAAIE